MYKDNNYHILNPTRKLMKRSKEKMDFHAQKCVTRYAIINNGVT
jgi:hypothetical protein